jgi:hypothetical protein
MHVAALPKKNQAGSLHVELTKWQSKYYQKIMRYAWTKRRVSEQSCQGDQTPC